MDWKKGDVARRSKILEEQLNDDRALTDSEKYDDPSSPFPGVTGSENYKDVPSIAEAEGFAETRSSYGPYPAKLTDAFGDAAPPFSSVCRLTLKFENGVSSIGTGFFVDENLILTSAHNLYDRVSRSAVSSIEAKLGVLSVTAGPYLTFSLVGARVPNSWTSASSEEEALNSDFGLVRVKSDTGSSNVTALTLRHSMSDDIWDNGNLGVLSIVGNEVSSQHQWWAAGTTVEAEDNVVKYPDIFTNNGWSGGPVIFFDAEEDRHEVVAIHSSTTNLWGNVGVRFTSSIHSTLLVWKSELSAGT